MSIIHDFVIEPPKQGKNALEDQSSFDEESIDVDFTVEDHADEIISQNVQSSRKRKRKSRFIDDEAEHSSDDESDDDENASDVDDTGKKKYSVYSE